MTLPRAPAHTLWMLKGLKPTYILGISVAKTTFRSMADTQNLYSFSAKDIDGQDVAFTSLKGKVVLVVNVASRCGRTAQDYPEMTSYYEKYKSQGFEVLGFPCNQFGGQEPGTNAQVKAFAANKYSVTFPMFSKIDVNGPDAHPLFIWLKSRQTGDVAWNFEKFLIGRDGNLVNRYSHRTLISSFEDDIKAALAK